MDSVLGHITLFFSVLIVQGEIFKTSNWTIDTSTTEVCLKKLFFLQRASPSFCAGYCDNVPKCNSFSIDKTSRICEGYSSEITLSSINLYNMAYYKRHINFFYEFLHHTFSTCGQKGRLGPTLSLCQLSYNTEWSLNSDYFNVVDGLQEWAIPKTGNYFIQAFGAAGGLGDTGMDNIPGGKGAEISGVFFLNMGTMLKIICGQKGTDAPSDEAGGGGGGTFVYTGTKGSNGLLIAAGGGGGGGEENTRAGFDGQASEQGLNSVGYSGSAFVNGNGGLGYGGVGGVSESAGAGWKSDGLTTDSTKCSGGQRWNGGIANKGGDGGFGGGGSGCNTRGGGGGGGYTGAAGLDGTNQPDRGGGGAGSYNNGANQVKITGSNLGHGFVYIELVSD